jgi:hypothetical protein
MLDIIVHRPMWAGDSQATVWYQLSLQIISYQLCMNFEE